MVNESVESAFLCSDPFCMTLKTEKRPECNQCRRITPWGEKMGFEEYEEDENGGEHQ